MGVTTAIRAPRGREMSCKGWHQEAALRMLHNNLDPDVADPARRLGPRRPDGGRARRGEVSHVRGVLLPARALGRVAQHGEDPGGRAGDDVLQVELHAGRLRREELEPQGVRRAARVRSHVTGRAARGPSPGALSRPGSASAREAARLSRTAMFPGT